MKAITGQYECLHRSGIGLDYFTSRVDRLILWANGRFSFNVQEKSRISHAAGSLFSGQQVDTNAPEIKREGRYSSQGNNVSFFFNDGTQEQGQLSANGIQIGNDFFEKVSDSTILPPTHRMKSNMEDIARGLKIAGTIGGAAMKAVKTLQDTVHTAQGPQTPVSNPSTPGQQTQGYQSPQSSPASTPSQSTGTATSEQGVETLFCDQCGAPVRLGKRFCSHCGARLP